jgi:hypothetical protein
LFNARVANGNKRELRGHKECVGQDKQSDGDELQQGKTVHLACEDSTSEIEDEGSAIRVSSRAPIAWNQSVAGCV